MIVLIDGVNVGPAVIQPHVRLMHLPLVPDRLRVRISRLVKQRQKWLVK